MRIYVWKNWHVSTSDGWSGITRKVEENVVCTNDTAYWLNLGLFYRRSLWVDQWVSKVREES